MRLSAQATVCRADTSAAILRSHDSVTGPDTAHDGARLAPRWRAAVGGAAAATMAVRQPGARLSLLCAQPVLRAWRQRVSPGVYALLMT